YIDQFTAGGAGRNRPLSQSMTATYYNGKVLAISNDFLRAPDGSVLELRKEVLRIDPGERVTIEVTDYDSDRTGQPDSIKVGATVQGKGKPGLVFEAKETGASTGVFRAEFDTSENSLTPPPASLVVAQGDIISLHYEDAENTFPGHRTRRETLVYVRQPTDSTISIVESQFVHPAPLADDQTPEAGYLLPRPVTDRSSPKGIAYELPMTVLVVDPDAARDTRSTVTVELAIADRPPVAVLCEISMAFGTDNPSLIDVRNPALHEGRFVGQIQLQLGSENSPPAIPATAIAGGEALLGPVLSPDGDARTLLSSNPSVPVLNLTGGDIIAATYTDETPSSPPSVAHTDYAQLASDAKLTITDPKSDEPATLLRVGERLYLTLSDPDLDVSDARDSASITVTTSTGERESLPLEETLSHSGKFSASFPLKAVKNPTQANFDPNLPAVEAFFGAALTASYNDRRPPARTEETQQAIEVPVAVGTDGIVSAFSKLFFDEELAIQTQFHIAESYFELFKSHRNLGRIPESEADLEAGQRTLRELQKDYPDPKYAPRITYLLGQFAQELADWDDAIKQYESVVRDHPDHTLAPEAQYKLGQCYEESERFDDALDAYVGLAATYPESPLIASVMIRITDRFYKEEEYAAAAGVGEKFLVRFNSHQWAPRIAFRVGQCYYKAEDYEAGGKSFDSFIKNFPDDELAPQALFWAGESYRMTNNVPDAFRRYNRCRWDYPESDAAKYSRGRLALPEMLAQFEREAQLDDAN
ncbi:MAG: tetratricopeptide repeat protein, partial [Verrucomicrobiales bacterium]|nr:tetratricopeptide repeat protein [Verrucomicrobiales bacterium]